MMRPLFDPDRYYRLAQIIGNRSHSPPIPAVIPISRAAWFRARNEGLIPPGRQISMNCIAWRGDTLNALFEPGLCVPPGQINSAPVPQIKRPRGRPRKHPSPVQPETARANDTPAAPIKRPRGRPRKHPLPTTQTDTAEA